MEKVLDYTLVALMTGLLATVLWQIVTRYALGDPSTFTEEAARFLLIWVGLLGATRAFFDDDHVGFSTLTAKLPDKWASNATRFRKGITILFAAIVLIFGGGQLTLVTLQLGQESAALGVPMAFIYSVIPISGILIVTHTALGDTLSPNDTVEETLV